IRICCTIRTLTTANDYHVGVGEQDSLYLFIYLFKTIFNEGSPSSTDDHLGPSHLKKYTNISG
ncbi:hypothetical protein, partial [Salmonella sp. s51090]|uniref:hypothetical protein n=1 Tax=Salmonella sp. s51090 TaxID=3159651 RepID=UPI00397F33D9